MVVALPIADVAEVEELVSASVVPPAGEAAVLADCDDDFFACFPEDFFGACCFEESVED